MPLLLKLQTWVIIVVMTLVTANAISQEMPLKKAKEEAPKHSVTKAAVFSAVIPGLGQAYNKKYWKIPIIYAGFGIIGYFIVTNNKEFKNFKEAYLYVANGYTYPIDNPYVTKYNQTQLKEAMDYYRRNRDLSYIIGGVWYTLNILEAYVDAHFFDYDISEDLTMHISPAAINIPAASIRPAAGIKVSFKF
jgi:hypothetical protein